MTEPTAKRNGILSGIKVLDIAHQYSGALSAALLGDLGADVLAVEHPSGSPIRTMLPKKDGQSLWWKVIQRGKRNITLNLSSPRGRELFIELARQHDVITENFRPGTLEKWHLGPSDLEAAGVNAALLRISGFGQTGPMRDLPGFGTVAEAFSGFANLNGFPDGPPVFPSTTLADGVAATFGTLGVLGALLHRFRNDSKGVEVVDVALFEGLFKLIPTQIAAFDQLGAIHKRPGNFLSSHGVLRNLYRTADELYFCVSAVGPQAIRRILVAADATELVARIDADVMHEAQERVESFLIDCNTHLTAWSEVRQYCELASRLAAAGAVYHLIYNASDIVRDPHYRARDDLLDVPDPGGLGSVLMQGVVPKFPGREHTISHAGRTRGADNDEIYRNLLHIGDEELENLRAQGVI